MASNTSGNSRRGLASADPETRKRVAAAGGRASHGGHGRKDIISRSEGPGAVSK